MTPILLAVLLLVLPQERRDELELDRVQLRDGGQLEGQVAYEDAESLALRRKSRITWIDRAEIVQVDARVRSLDELLDRLDALGPPGHRPQSGLLELARFALHSRLPGEAQLLAIEALLGDPESAEAAELAGAKWRRERWELELGERAPLSELIESGRPWKDRLALDTAHYHLETNLPLEVALGAAIDLERTQRAFQGVLGRELKLLDPRELMRVHLHADRASFPQPGSGRKSSFDPQDRIARALVELPPWRENMLHEAVRQLLFYTSRREPNAKGEVPFWFDVGLAEVLSLGSSGPLGAVRFDPGRVDATYVRAQSKARDPFSIERVLVFEPIDLDSHDDQLLKYAQSYTLVHFLLFGGDLDLRGAFLDSLRQAWDGKGGPSRFRKAIGVDLDELGERWTAYVATLAGR